jgi:uncharacterized membrane protein
MGMGAADVVPGVSGGTIAFISGIYEELIHSIKNINYATVSTLWKEGIVSFWKALNGNFLISVVGGILISVLFSWQGASNAGMRGPSSPLLQGLRLHGSLPA